MAILIKNPETERKARELASLKGQTLTAVIDGALDRALAEAGPERRKPTLDEMIAATERFRALSGIKGPLPPVTKDEWDEINEIPGFDEDEILIAVDSSALVAIALNEPARDLLLDTIRRAPTAYLSPINYTETGMVLRQKGFVSGAEVYDAWLGSLSISIRDDVALGGPAFAAFLEFGKGRHPARLNLGDCFAYALAKALDAPLLYKGDDFAKTDVRSAL